MKFLDTQIISYKYKESKDLDIRDNIIPSVVAMEFLLMQSDKPHAANYYIPKVNRFYSAMGEQLKIDHPFRKESSDNLIFDFGKLSESFAMFSNFNISELINTQNISLFDTSISFLEKSQQKSLKKKIRFIVNNNLTCEPIVKDDIEIGYGLLNDFLSKYNSKGNFRNTWNDILILSKAISKRAPLLTEDKLLNRFASENYQAKTTEKNGILDIDFSIYPELKKKKSSESKGYINRGWQYMMNKNNAT